MTSPSPGQIARYLKNKHYKTEEAYIYALADVMKREYKAIVDAGFVLQLDCPDLAMLRHMVYLDKSLADFRKIIAVNVARSITPSQTSPPTACACMCAGARRSRRITPTCRSRTSSTSCLPASRRQCRSRPPMRGTSTSGKSGAM